MKGDAQDRAAMRLIRRAAILLEEGGEGCLTPGANYALDFYPDRISAAVNLTTEQQQKLAQLPEYKRQAAEDILHSYFQVAVWKILEGNVI